MYFNIKSVYFLAQHYLKTFQGLCYSLVLSLYLFLSVCVSSVSLALSYQIIACNPISKLHFKHRQQLLSYNFQDNKETEICQQTISTVAPKALSPEQALLHKKHGNLCGLFLSHIRTRHMLFFTFSFKNHVFIILFVCLT